MNSFNIYISTSVQMVTCSTVDVEGLQTFNFSILSLSLAFSSLRQIIESLQTFSFSILETKFSFSILRQEIESLHMLSSLVKFSHFLLLEHKHFPN
jgi:hypothetical protein